MPRLLQANQARKRPQNDLPSELLFAGKLDIHAAEKDKADGLPTFSLLANTGAPMEVNGWPYPVVVDLPGAKFVKASSPVLMHHNRRLRLGHTTKQEITTGRKGKVTAEGVVSSTSKTAKLYVADSKNGFPFEVSLGARVMEAEFLEAGETAQVNDRTVKGPVYIARETLIRELTVDVLGADSKTTAKIAATQKTQGNPTMFEEWLKAMGLDSETLTDEQRGKLEASYKDAEKAKKAAAKLKASGKTGGKPPKKITASDPEDGDLEDDDDDDDVSPLAKRRNVEAAESERVDGIRTLFARYAEVDMVQPDPNGDNPKTVKAATFKANAIRQGLSVSDVELVLLRASMPGGAGEGPAIHVKVPFEGEIFSEALSCAVARDCFGMPASFKKDGREYGYEHQFSEKALSASEHRRIRHPSLHYMMDLVIQAAEGTPYSGNRKSNDFAMAYVEAAIKLQGGPRRKLDASGPFSTLTVNYIFENVANKLLEQRFAMQASTWQEIVRIKNLTDFKPHTLYRLDENLGYLKVGPSGELKHGGLTDSKKTVQAETFGRLIALTREHQRNDDMDAFQQIITGLVEGSAWAIESAVYTLLLANSGSFFHADNKNLIDDDLSIGGISRAEETFMNQVSASGKPIVSQPDRLLCGTQDGVLASDIFGKSALLASDTNGSQVFQENPHKGKYRVVKTPYLNNTAIRTPDGQAISGQSSDLWFLFGNPNLAAAIILGAVDGRIVPFIESSETSFDTLGMQWRGYHHIGVAQGDTQGAVMSSGDAESA
jgi:hypothetical protein